MKPRESNEERKVEEQPHYPTDGEIQVYQYQVKDKWKHGSSHHGKRKN